MLLNGDIGEVYEHVIQFTQTGCVLDSAKPTETKFIPAKEKKTTIHHVHAIYTYVFACIMSNCVLVVHNNIIILNKIGSAQNYYWGGGARVSTVHVQVHNYTCTCTLFTHNTVNSF